MKKKSTSKDDIIVNSDDVENEVKSIKDEQKDDEPSFKHYLIVIGVILGIFGILYFGFEIYDNYKEPDVVVDQLQTYKYPYKVGSVTYNLFFYYTTEELDEFDYDLEPSKVDVLNTVNFTFSFDEYNGSDNGKVSISSIKFMKFLRDVYRFNFDVNDSFVSTQDINCANSTIKNKVVTFNPYANETKVKFNRINGCIEFEADDPQKIIGLSDKFIYEITKQ